MIYAVVNSKGGVGKSTCAAHFATMLARTGKTLLIDGDPQLSIVDWAALRRASKTKLPSPTTTQLFGEGLLDEGRELSQGYENTVVDAGGRDSPSLRSALLLADRAVIPVGASTFDALAFGRFVDLVELSKDYNRSLDVKVLLNQIDTRTKDLEEMVEVVKEHSMVVLESYLCHRVAFQRVITTGSTVHENKKKDKLAIKEMESVFEEITA